MKELKVARTFFHTGSLRTPYLGDLLRDIDAILSQVDNILEKLEVSSSGSAL